FGQASGHGLDQLVARIGDRVDGVAEPDDHFLLPHAPADVLLGLSGARVAPLDLVGDLVGAAVLGPLESPYASDDGRVHVRAGTGDHAAGEGRGVELVLGVEDLGDVHRL